MLKPAALRAGLSVFQTAKGKTTSAANFQPLRRTSSTLVGARAKDPKSTQAHIRHTDPYVTLKHDQREIPAEVKATALALERDLLNQKRKRPETLEANGEKLPIVWGFGWAAQLTVSPNYCETWSHRRELNPRPAVYKFTCRNDIKHIAA